jgi:hypothetical protein
MMKIYQSFALAISCPSRQVPQSAAGRPARQERTALPVWHSNKHMHEHAAALHMAMCGGLIWELLGQVQIGRRTPSARPARLDYSPASQVGFTTRPGPCVTFAGRNPDTNYGYSLGQSCIS